MQWLWWGMNPQVKHSTTVPMQRFKVSCTRTQCSDSGEAWTDKHSTTVPKQGLMCLTEGHNAVTLVRLEPTSQALYHCANARINVSCTRTQCSDSGEAWTDKHSTTVPKQGLMCLAQGHNAVPLVRHEPTSQALYHCAKARINVSITRTKCSDSGEDGTHKSSTLPLCQCKD